MVTRRPRLEDYATPDYPSTLQTQIRLGRVGVFFNNERINLTSIASYIGKNNNRTVVNISHPNEYSGDWSREAQMSTQQLQFGKKIIDTKSGSRAAMHAYPFFQLGLEQEVSENYGKVLVGTIGWTGNFRFTFEVDTVGNLRVISGINPYASNYELMPGEVFTTPEFIFTFSENGLGNASRNLHRWARNYQLKDGKGDRLTLLNNRESTGFDFDKKTLSKLMGEAKELGVDMFLLDDGWFGNKYPRVNDKAGLSDWDVMRSKLTE
jgi:alpha-galactosidase